MALTPGTRLGVYEITVQIGEGGMGQVWRATDTTLGRQVAIKILPDAFAADPERLARFEREARTLAALNHPHIAAIYGFEKSAGRHALVMELVEGEDLSQRLARGAVPLDEALPIARQIAEALEAAHEQGIIHRDLKPANIKVRPDGTVKVLDFGLAKAMDAAPGGRDVSPADRANSPTITTPAMTHAGMILGTAAYMAPEQAKGRPLDRRADMWAFGAVLYEMLTGQRAFVGDDVTDTIVSVLSKEPAWSALPAGTPGSMRTLLRRCLEKDRKRRLDSAAAARLEIEDALTAPVESPGRPPRSRALPWAVAAATVLAAGVMLQLWAPWQSAAVLPETRVDIVTPASGQLSSFALSPDGRQIVFAAAGAAVGDGALRLWLRSLATTTAHPLEGTDGATAPFWSADGRSIGFFSGNALKRLDLGGGEPVTLAPVSAGLGGTWNADGDILFADSRTTPLKRVSANGGAVTVVTTLDAKQSAHGAPHFLPDGRRFLFSVLLGTPDATGIYLGNLAGGTPKRLTPTSSAGLYVAETPGAAANSGGGGWLLSVRAGALVAQRLDAAAEALTGDPVTVAADVEVEDLFGSAVSATTAGLIAYRTGAGSQRQLTWVDRSGTVRGTLGEADGSDLRQVRISPDGHRVLVSRTVQGNEDIWLLDGPRRSRVTYDVASEQFPVWSPDGLHIVFRSNRIGVNELYLALASGGGGEKPLVTSDQRMTPTSWSADGRFLVYHSPDPRTESDLWVMPMAGDHTPVVVVKTPFNERWGALSPDGRWLAYHSNESGRNEIHIRPFVPPAGLGAAIGARAGQTAAPAGQWQASTTGGIYPVWRPDGKELYYLSPSGAMMATPITVSGPTLQAGQPSVLFETRIYRGGADSGLGRQYDVAPDGRFLINTVVDQQTAPITLLQNWHPEPKQ